MNTNPSAKTILCYGDSNTWGQTHDKKQRYPADVRWPGVLQRTLGETFYVIEEGLNSRTTDLDYPRKPGRNGKTYLEPCLDAHVPLDMVILMLGSNDFKIEFNRSAQQIAAAIRGLIEVIQARTAPDNGPPAKVLLASPIHIDENASRFKEWYQDVYDHRSAVKSLEVAAELEVVAKELGCIFIDAAKAGDDGIHLDEASHPALGKLLAETLRAEFA